MLRPFGLILIATFSQAAPLEPARVQDIIKRSVANVNASWALAPQFDFTERDIVTTGTKRTVKTYQVMMIDGTPYNKQIAAAGHPLSSAQTAEQDRKLQREIVRRRAETPAARQKRIAGYKRQRQQDLALLQEMAAAFDFQSAGEETINGRKCFVLAATPRPGYQPRSRDTRVLKGMRGKMWIDEQQYEWVKVHAEVFRPVSFGLFFASVKPGTEFTLEEQPVRGNIWLPSHFTQRVNARVFLSSRNSTDDETYWNYRPAAAAR